jgi:hypothetical protein
MLKNVIIKKNYFCTDTGMYKTVFRGVRRHIDFDLGFKIFFIHFLSRFLINSPEGDTIYWAKENSSFCTRLELKGQCHKIRVEIRPWSSRLYLNS